MRPSVFFIYVVLLGSCSVNNTIRSDKPVTREDAGKVVHLALPASASEIYYLLYAGGMQVLQAYTRFHVDPAQADLAIEELIAKNNKTMKRSLPYARSPLPPPRSAGPLIDREGRFTPIAWWQPQTIRNGYFRGEEQSYALRIWYDADESLIYVSQID